jgi:hypothetical protein
MAPPRCGLVLRYVTPSLQPQMTSVEALYLCTTGALPLTLMSKLRY